MKAASILFSLVSLAALPVMATPYVGSSLGTAGTTFDLLSEVRFCNFIENLSAANAQGNLGIEALIQNSTGTPNNTASRGDINPQSSSWAKHNDFTITYVPEEAKVYVHLVGKNDNTVAYTVNVSRTTDPVTQGPVNYIDFSLMDRMSGSPSTFPTFTGLHLASLDGFDLGAFSISSMGTGVWGIIDPGGATLSNGFTLAGSFDIDLTALVGQAGGTDNIKFDIGYNSLVTAQSLNGNQVSSVDAVPDAAATASLLGISMLALFGLRRKVAA